MAEPQPPSVHEGADIDDEAPALPKSAEDRKAAAALSSVSARDDDSTEPAKEVDQEALGRAMKNLDVSGGVKPATVAKEDAVRDKKKAAVKVDQADVALLVSASSGRKLCLGISTGGGGVIGRWALMRCDRCRWMSWTCQRQKQRIYSRIMMVTP